jgi:hypothetical protein
MKKLGVLILRGSGDTGFHRQEKFIDKLNKRLLKKKLQTSDICYSYADWYGPLQEQQEKLLQRMNDEPGLNLRSKTIRKLLITNIADLITYGGLPGFPGDAYHRMHKLVHDAIIQLKIQLPDNGPLVILASSMGTEIINNYIWDRQQGYDADIYGASAFERLETLAGLFTFGNNIPIFASSFDIDELQPIRFPMPGLDEKYQTIAIWQNYYDKNDPLGYPVKFLNRNYAGANVSDIQVGVGNPLSAWNILSHFGYWTSRKVEKIICNFIAELFEKVV